MRLILMGTGPFAVPSCRSIQAAGHEIALVVTRPLADPNAKKVPPRPVYDWANETGLPLFEPASINDPAAIDRLRAEDADLFFVCDYGQILSRDCLQASRIGGINLHGSLLPRHRGAAPVQWTLLRGDTVGGVTVIHMTPGLDAGPAIAVRQVQVLPDENAEDLESRLADLGSEATMEAIQRLAEWDGQSQIGQVQDRSRVTKAPRFSKRDGQLDMRLPAEYLVRLIRACQPWPGTFAELRFSNSKQMRVIVRAARSAVLPKTVPPLQTGQAAALTADSDAWQHFQAAFDDCQWQSAVAVGTGDGILLLGRLQPAGKRVMTADEFLRGYPLPPLLVEGSQGGEENVNATCEAPLKPTASGPTQLDTKRPAEFLLPDSPAKALCQ